MKPRIAQLLFAFIVLESFIYLSLGKDMISSAGVVIKDPESMVSEKQMYKLGFFSPPNTTHRYLGVFFAFSEEAVIWVANRGQPLQDSSGTLTLSPNGNLLLLNGANETLWSTNLTTTVNSTVTVQILDSGNLVLAEEGKLLWESFSQPSDVMVSGMTLSQNVKTGKKVMMTAWKNASDPEIGSFTGGLDALAGIPQMFVWEDGRPHWRSGPWNGLIFIGIKEMFYGFVDGFTQVNNDTGGGYTYSRPEATVYVTSHVNSSGSAIRRQWDIEAKRWEETWSQPSNECDFYGKCGPFGTCNTLDLPICTCLRGFEPVIEEEWGRGNWSNGCRRKNQLQCGGEGEGDGFARLKYMKVPDFAQPSTLRVQGDCGRRCLGNCSCIAYAYDPKIGCMFWTTAYALIDTQEFDRVGVDLYIRLSASEFDGQKQRKLYIIIPVAVVFVCLSTLVFIVWWMVVKRKGKISKNKDILEAGQMFTTDSTAIVLRDESNEVTIGELPKFTFEMLANATNRFHESNLLGKGGFGMVYKGILANGKEIAVKRLSAEYGQGMQEFMNEVIVISKLQHRNLVRLLGGCVEKEERILIYEYMANKSLDACLFGPRNATNKVLDWKSRYNIIEGIGRGILYLHKDSRLRIIHRDLKSSNVLLDHEWHPKISDFGMARIFGGNEDHGSTTRVVGTYGYMAPEYAMEGRFSEKSDVYSFGVLILEIVKGKKNTHYVNDEWSLSLIGCAWKMWSEGNGLGFVEESIASREMEEEMVRCIQIGLLCVQEIPKDRPAIEILVSMLSGEITELPLPKHPVFAAEMNNGSSPQLNEDGYSINGLTLTQLDGR